MAPASSPVGGDPLRDSADFSLVLGGPLFQLFRRAHMTGDGLELVRRRTIVTAAIAWLPLVVLAALEGNALGGGVAVPFLRDMDVHIRFLVALPLLVVAERVVHQRLRPVARQFLDRKVIPASATEKFEAALTSIFRLRNSVIAELALIGIVYLVGISLVWRQYTALATATWYATPTAAGPSLSLAGWWYAYVSLPFFQFLLLRWYFRVFIWTRFFLHVSRIELSLVPTHPDRVGGLGFLSNTAYALVPLAAAHGAMLAGVIANHIFYEGAALLDFKVEVGSMLVLVSGLAFGPLLVFSPRLATAKRTGLREYGGEVLGLLENGRGMNLAVEQQRQRATAAQRGASPCERDYRRANERASGLRSCGSGWRKVTGSES